MLLQGLHHLCYPYNILKQRIRLHFTQAEHRDQGGWQAHPGLPDLRPLTSVHSFILRIINLLNNQLETGCVRHHGCSVQFSHSVVSDSLQPHESQRARPPNPSPTPRVYSNSCPSSRWWHPAISSSVIPFSSCPQSFPASGSFPMRELLPSGGQSIGVSASASVLPMNTQDVKTDKTYSLTHESFYFLSVAIFKITENLFEWHNLMTTKRTLPMIKAPSLLFSSSFPPFLSVLHKEEWSYKTQYIRSCRAMYDGHWNIMSQIRIPRESISGVSETNRVAQSSL